MNSLFNWQYWAARIQEPSTWAGIGVGLLAAREYLPESWRHYAAAAAGICTGFSIVLASATGRGPPAPPKA